jgi:hypothetical protein
METSKLRWDDIGRQLVIINKKIEESEISNREVSRAITKEKEDRTEAINKESLARESFEQGIKSNVKLVSWIIGTLASIAAISTGIMAIVQFGAK